jgi:hypothetical protein
MRNGQSGRPTSFRDQVAQPYDPDEHGSVSLGVLHARMIKCIGIRERDDEPRYGVCPYAVLDVRTMTLVRVGGVGCAADGDRSAHARADPGSEVGVFEGVVGCDSLSAHHPRWTIRRSIERGV